MAKAKSRAQQFEDDEHIVKDYDPEADGRDVESDNESDASEDKNAGTEHYETVGKSNLRQKDGVSLGPQYRGSKVSRAALEQESDEEEDGDDDEGEGSSGSEGEYADPELVDLEADEAEASDSEIESDNALAESDVDRFKGFAFRGSSKPAKGKKGRATAADFMSSSDEEGGADVGEDDDAEMDDSDEDEDMDDGLDALADGLSGSEEENSEASDDEEEEGDEEEEDEDSESEDEDRPAKKDTTNGAKSAAPALAASSANADIQKGKAIQQQRKIYDGLLNLRIRLQKALIAANTFPTLEDGTAGESEPYEAAEEAAVKLLNTISDLKFDFGPSGAKAGTKRKRGIDVSTPSEQIWEQLQADEKRISKTRKATMEKWSQKVRAVNDASGKKSLTSSLEEQLANTEYRLIKRTRVPRSCAPAQAAKRVAEDENIYDDADFYQQLLKELVEQRTVDESSGAQQMGSVVPSVMLTASKDAKARKVVDRKASKGRKMRFTVHEKLQNFMAPEDRRQWEQGAIDRFFGTMFGQKMVLDDGEEEESEDEDLEELRAEAEGLRLFK